MLLWSTLQGLELPAYYPLSPFETVAETVEDMNRFAKLIADDLMEIQELAREHAVDTI